MMLGTYGELIQGTEELVKLSTQLRSNPDPSRDVGYITHWRFGSPMFSRSIGTVANNENANDYWAFSREKAFRLQADMMRKPSTTVSSWQTRDLDIERYGGGIICNLDGDRNKPHDIYSFSGLNESVDEAVALALALENRAVHEDFVKRVVEISNNGVFNELWDAWQNLKEMG